MRLLAPKAQVSHVSLGSFSGQDENQESDAMRVLHASRI